MLMTSHDEGRTWSQAKTVAGTTKPSDHSLLIGDGAHAFLLWQTKDGYRLMPLDDLS